MFQYVLVLDLFRKSVVYYNCNIFKGWGVKKINAVNKVAGVS